MPDAADDVGIIGDSVTRVRRVLRTLGRAAIFDNLDG
jgi:hypothetical protein